jgi:hypothetical protein
MYRGLHMKYPLFFSDVNEASNFLEIFSKKYSNIKFHEYLFSGSPVSSTRTDEQTDVTKLIVAIRNFADSLKWQVSAVFTRK